MTDRHRVTWDDQNRPTVSRPPYLLPGASHKHDGLVSHEATIGLRLAPEESYAEVRAANRRTMGLGNALAYCALAEAVELGDDNTARRYELMNQTGLIDVAKPVTDLDYLLQQPA